MADVCLFIGVINHISQLAGFFAVIIANQTQLRYASRWPIKMVPAPNSLLPPPPPKLVLRWNDAQLLVCKILVREHLVLNSLFPKFYCILDVYFVD